MFNVKFENEEVLKMKKKMLCLMLTIIMLVVSCTACSSTNENNGESTSEATYNWSMACGTAADSPMTWFAQDIADRVAEKSDGRINITVFDDTQLGSERETMEQMQAHALEMNVVSGAVMSGFWGGWSMYSLPYLFDSREDSMGFYKTETSAELNALYEENTGVKVLGLHPEGFICIANKTKAINSPSDLKGLTIRCMEAQMLVEGLNSMGATAVTTNWGEAITALQTGLVDGFSLTSIGMYTYNLDELMPYLAITNTFLDNCFVVIDAEIWDSLSEDDQKILQEATDEAMVQNMEVLTQIEEEAIAGLTERGAEITYPVINEFSELVQPVYKTFYSDYPDLQPIVESILQ